MDRMPWWALVVMLAVLLTVAVFVVTAVGA